MEIDYEGFQQMEIDFVQPITITQDIFQPTNYNPKVCQAVDMDVDYQDFQPLDTNPEVFVPTPDINEVIMNVSKIEVRLSLFFLSFSRFFLLLSFSRTRTNPHSHTDS